MGISLVKCAITKIGRLELSHGYPTQEKLPVGQKQRQGGQKGYMAERRRGWWAWKCIRLVYPKSEKQWRPLLYGAPKNLYTRSTGCLFDGENLQSRGSTVQIIGICTLQCLPLWHNTGGEKEPGVSVHVGLPFGLLSLWCPWLTPYHLPSYSNLSSNPDREIVVPDSLAQAWTKSTLFLSAQQSRLEFSKGNWRQRNTSKENTKFIVRVKLTEYIFPTLQEPNSAKLSTALSHTLSQSPVQRNSISYLPQTFSPHLYVQCLLGGGCERPVAEPWVIRT